MLVSIVGVLVRRRRVSGSPLFWKKSCILFLFFPCPGWLIDDCLFDLCPVLGWQYNLFHKHSSITCPHVINILQLTFQQHYRSEAITSYIRACQYRQHFQGTSFLRQEGLHVKWRFAEFLWGKDANCGGVICFQITSLPSPYLVVKLREGVTGEAAPPDFVVNQAEVLLNLLIWPPCNN